MSIINPHARVVLEPAPQDLAEATATPQALAHAADPLGPLALLPGPDNTPGVWSGHGLNLIWRPHRLSTGQDHFLEVNLTDETITFTRINADILNRGLAMSDINLHGVTYLQQIHEAGHSNKGLHIEPGIWASVPQTSDPAQPATVVRMASIPHGTVINAQGVYQATQEGPPNIPDNNILPYYLNSPAPIDDQFAQIAGRFPELELSIPSRFRSLSNGVTEEMVRNPNSVLQQALQASLQQTTMKRCTVLRISTTNSIIPEGGGIANIAFLAASRDPVGGNAKATRVDATFWIETIAGTEGNPDIQQLQYTQLVMLDYNNTHWPHVTVGTLRKQDAADPAAAGRGARGWK